MREEENKDDAPKPTGSDEARRPSSERVPAESAREAKEPPKAGGAKGTAPEAADHAPPGDDKAQAPARAELPSGGEEPAPAAEQPSVDQIMPPEAHQVTLPVVGSLPIRTVAVLVCLAALAFVLVLTVGLALWGSEETPGPEKRLPLPVGVPTASGQPGPGSGLAAGAAAPLDLGQFGYAELVEGAERSVKGDDLASAAVLYRTAADREDAGLPKVLLARFRLAEVLLELGRHDEALRLCESLRSVSRPGDELWKNALILSIRVLGAQGNWEDAFRQVYLLRANTARYGDQASLDRWLAYCQAMAKVRMFLSRSTVGSTLYGMRPPAFGQGPCATRPLAAEDIIPASGNYGDGTLTAQYTGGELRLRSEGAPLGQVLAEIGRVAGLTITFEGAKDYPVSACLETLSPENGLELVLGSVGLAADDEGGKLVVHRMAPVPKSKEDALKAALWSLQEFLILYPESAHVPEAYYALGHLYMTQGQTKMALDQLEILGREFPQSPWSVYGHYVAGRALADMEDWEGGERELITVVDSDPDGPLSQSAFLWAAQCEVGLRKYTEAVACFRRALAYQTEDPVAPGILYRIAFCLEKSGASPLEVEERYTELRSRYPGTEYAREADYRLARMALEGGEYEKAVMRYEFYLSGWSLEDQRSRQACADLVQAYVRAGEDVRAALLGEVMCSAFGKEPEYGQALPLVLDAHEKAGMETGGLELIDRSAAATEDAGRRLYLMVRKAGFLTNLQRYDEAQTLLGQVETDPQARDLLQEANLVRARILAGRGEPDKALAGWREVALRAPSEEVRARALTLMGRHYETTKEFDKAALAYAGKCPVDGGRSAP